MTGKRNSLSLAALGVIILVWIAGSFWYGNHERRLVNSDAIHYYSYLPAVFIKKDIRLSFITKTNLPNLGFYYLPEYTPDGKPLIKTTMGLAILLAPFFLLAHLFADTPDGVSQIYQNMTGIVGGGFYLLVGIWCLRKLLLRFFNDRVTAATLLILVMGTNLLFYTFGEPIIAHLYLFSLLAVFLYATVQWNEHHLLKYACLLALSGGFLTLIRPTMILFLPVPLLYGITSVETLQLKLKMLKQHYGQLLLMGGILFLCALPQVLYWKMITGHWVYFSYTNERFYWNQSRLADMWFSYRKGWFLYTPVMVFSIGGLMYLRKYTRQFLLPVLLVLPVTFYILSCWWVWWYGGSISQRAYVDFYALLAIPLACSIQRVTELKKQVPRFGLYAVLFVFSMFSLFKVWQYCKYLIHHDGMNKKLYWETLLVTEGVDSYWSKLHFPNYSRALRGLPQYITHEGKQLLVRDDLDLASGPWCVTDSQSNIPGLSIPFANLRIPHGNKLYGLVDFTSTKPLSDSCRLVIKIVNEHGTWAEQSVTLNSFMQNGKGRAAAAIVFTFYQSEHDALKVYVSNPLHEHLCIQSLMLGEEVY